MAADRRTLRAQKVLYDDGIAFMDKEDRPAQFHLFDTPGENRKWVQAEGGLILVALGVNRSRVAVDRELVAPAVDDQSFFEFGEQEDAFGWRFNRGEEQAVIPAGIEPS